VTDVDSSVDGVATVETINRDLDPIGKAITLEKNKQFRTKGRFSSGFRGTPKQKGSSPELF